VKGVFFQSPAQSFVVPRRHLLGGTRHLDPPAKPTSTSADEVDAVVSDLRAQLAQTGAAITMLDRPMTNDEFLALGSALGIAQPERSDGVQVFVTHGVILNLITGLPRTDDPDLQPFGTNWLSLHSESSGAPPSVQPRYIVLMCVEPGSGVGAQTVLVPMQAVADTLSESDRAVLRSTRYALNEGAPMLMREEHGRVIFSVRDFQEDPLSWEHCGDASDPRVVARALERLYQAMYGSAAFGISWKRALLAVIDNTVFFHGRTTNLPHESGPPRHLKRLRISVPVVVA
jgi:Taurine catabolism dioxygenase TauD, TfdA family